MGKKSSSQSVALATACSLCDTTATPLLRCQGGYVCEDCAESSRAGRDMTTKALRDRQRGARARRDNLTWNSESRESIDVLEYVEAAGELLSSDALRTQVPGIRLAGGELAAASSLPTAELTADVVSLDASAERVALVSSLGSDIAALALDTAETAGAVGSIEQMMAHQVAAAHHQAMTMLSRANLEPDSAHQLRLSALATKWMAASQGAALTLQKLKTGGEQRVLVQHVNVNKGGQAVIGDIQTGGR